MRRGGSLVEVRLEIDGQAHGVEKLLAHGSVDGENIAQGDAGLACDNRFERHPLRVIRPLIDDDEPRAVARRDFAGPFIQPRPLQARQRRRIEVAVNHGAEIGCLTIAMGTGQVKLTPTVYGAIAIIVGLALEFPLVRHRGAAFGVTALRNDTVRSCKPSRCLPTLSRSPCR